MKAVSKIDLNMMKRPYSFIGLSKLTAGDHILKVTCEKKMSEGAFVWSLKVVEETLLVLSVYLAFTDRITSRSVTLGSTKTK